MATAKERLDELFATFDTAMLITRRGNCESRSRPVAMVERSAGGKLFFALRMEASDGDDVVGDGEVVIVMQDARRFLSVTGRATRAKNKDLITQVWTPALKLWFPQGLEDARLAVVQVEPRHAEFWQRSDLSVTEFLWEAGKAIVKGKKLADSDRGGYETVEL